MDDRELCQKLLKFGILDEQRGYHYIRRLVNGKLVALTDDEAVRDWRGNALSNTITESGKA